MIGNGLFRNVFRAKLSALDRFGNPLDGLGNLHSGSVVDRKAQRHSIVAFRRINGPLHLSLNHGIQVSRPADDFESQSLTLNFAAFLDQVLLEQMHQQCQFFRRALPVFAGEAKQRQLFHSQP